MWNDERSSEPSGARIGAGPTGSVLPRNLPLALDP